MALNAANLSAAVSDRTDTFPVNYLWSDWRPGYFARIDSEYSVITEIVGVAAAAGSLVVRSRGSFGGASVAHARGAQVVCGPIAELNASAPGKSTAEAVMPQERRVRSLYAGGIVDVSTILEDTTLMLAMISAGQAYVLTHPTPAQNWRRLIIINGTAQVHTFTVAAPAGGFQPSATTLTINANGSAELEAYGTSWYVRVLDAATMT